MAASSPGDRVRVLHLIDVLPGSDGRCLHHQVRRTIEGLPADCEHVLLEVGAGERSQPELPETHGRIGTMGDRMLANGEALQDVLDTWSHRAGPFDLVHAWGTRSLHLRSTCDDGPPCIGTLDTATLRETLIEALLRLHSSTRLQVQAGCAGMVKVLQKAGLGELDLACRPFGTDLLPVDAGQRESRRAQWGADEQTLVFGVFGDPKHWTSLRTLVGVPTRFALVGRSVRIVAHPESDGFQQCRTWLQSMGNDRLLVADESMDTPWSMLPHVDAVLLQGTSGRRGEAMGMLPLAWSLGSGLPILLGHGHPADRELEGNPGIFRSVDRDENGATRWVMARTEANEATPASDLRIDEARWCEQVRCDYDSLMA